MSDQISATETLDVQGLNCPMPVIKTKQNIDDLDKDAVIEVVSTDSGSMNDLSGWADNTNGVELLDQHVDENEEVYTYYIRKTE